MTVALQLAPEDQSASFKSFSADTPSAISTKRPGSITTTRTGHPEN